MKISAERFVRIHEPGGDAAVRYLYTAPSCIRPLPPRKLRPLPAEVIEFDLAEEKWAALQRAASLLDKMELRIRADADGVSFTTYDHKYPSGHEFSIAVSLGSQTYSCNTFFRIENLKLLKGSYHVAVTPTYTMFRLVSGYDVTYWVGCHPDSTFWLSAHRPICTWLGSTAAAS